MIPEHELGDAMKARSYLLLASLIAVVVLCVFLIARGRTETVEPLPIATGSTGNSSDSDTSEELPRPTWESFQALGLVGATDENEFEDTVSTSRFQQMLGDQELIDGLIEICMQNADTAGVSRLAAEKLGEEIAGFITARSDPDPQASVAWAMSRGRNWPDPDDRAWVLAGDRYKWFGRSPPDPAAPEQVLYLLIHANNRIEKSRPVGVVLDHAATGVHYARFDSADSFESKQMLAVMAGDDEKAELWIQRAGHGVAFTKPQLSAEELIARRGSVLYAECYLVIRTNGDRHAVLFTGWAWDPSASMWHLNQANLRADSGHTGLWY